MCSTVDSIVISTHGRHKGALIWHKQRVTSAVEVYALAGSFVRKDRQCPG